MKQIVLIASIFIFCSTYGQKNEAVTCKHLILALDHIKKDKILKLRTIRVDLLLREGWGYNRFLIEYAAIKLNLTKEEVSGKGIKEANHLWQRIEENSSYAAGSLIDCESVKISKSRPNAILSKLDEETLLIDLTLKRTGKEGPAGKTYLFIFEGQRIIKVLESDWVE